jgi:MoaA/NifB/PqqE/SkfB family radical SAM enzyme
MYSYKEENRIEQEKLRRSIDWYNKKPSPPFKIDVELHRRCNLKCLPCLRQHQGFDFNEDSKQHEMSLIKWLDIVNQAANLGILVWNIEGGGEPMALKELTIPVMDEVKRSGMYGVITTNGTLWTEEELKNLVKIKWDRIHFSIDGPDAKTHDYLRGVKGCFKKTVNNIRILNKWKKKFGTENPMLSINLVLNKKNYNKLDKIVKLSYELKADYIFVEPLIVFSKAGANLKLSDLECKKLPEHVKKAKILAEKYKIDNNFATKDENLSEELVKNTSVMNSILIKDVKEVHDSLLSSPCDRPWNNMAVKYNGLTGHCGLLQRGENVKEKSLKEIWQRSFLKKVRKDMLKKKLLDHCSRCVPSDVTQRRRLREEIIRALKEEKWMN